MEKCCVCGSPYGELHHVVFRSQSKHMINISINHIYLCAEHHRGNNSPHKKREIDLKYKNQVQDKLYNLLDDEYITIDKLMEKLEITETLANKIVKTLRINKEGYERNEIIRELMGGRLY